MKRSRGSAACAPTPRRNDILDRLATKDEATFLEEPGASF